MVSRRERDASYQHEFESEEQKADYQSQRWEHPHANHAPHGASGYDQPRPSHPTEYHRQEPSYPPDNSPRYEGYPPPSHQQYQDHPPRDDGRYARDAYAPPSRGPVESYYPCEGGERQHSERHQQQQPSRYRQEQRASRGRPERHYREHFRSNRSTPSPPRVQDCQQRWQGVHDFADQHSTTGYHDSSPEEDDDESSRTGHHQHTTESDDSNSIASHVTEEEAQRRAFAEFARIKDEQDELKLLEQFGSATKVNGIEEDKFSPSKRFEYLKTMTPQEREQEHSCPIAVPKPPPAPFDLKMTHRPEFWEPTNEKEKSKTKQHKKKKQLPKPTRRQQFQPENTFQLRSEHDVQFQPENNFQADARPASRDTFDKQQSDHCVSKCSWEAPYQMYEDCKKKLPPPQYYSSSSDSDHSKKLPAKASSKSSIKSSGSKSSASSGMVGAFCEKPQVMIEIMPGMALPLRGSDETMRSIQLGLVTETSCMACSTNMVVATECTFAICPVCRTVNRSGEPTIGDGEFVGLGLLQEVYATTKREQNNATAAKCTPAMY